MSAKATGEVIMLATPKSNIVNALSAALLAAICGCGSSPPPRELVDARTAYARAQDGPATHTNPDDLRRAKEALSRAETSYRASADDEDTRTLAYVAERRAELADVRAHDAMNVKREQIAKVEYQDLALARLAQTQAQLRATGQRAQEADLQRVESDRKAREALDHLAAAVGGSVKEESRGLVLTMPGQVVFAVGKSTLLPSARRRLDQVSQVLKGSFVQKIVVEGHTDSTGTSELNQRLSEQRAATVRDYLVSKGVPRGQIESHGLGDGHPVTDNRTPESRAENRRVEIVVEMARAE
jgi:outer membrane protein OmpA-like peptidoglycan-associated protein